MIPIYVFFNIPGYNNILYYIFTFLGEKIFTKIGNMEQIMKQKTYTNVWEKRTKNI